MAIGVWLCEAINSCADPGLSSTVLETQFEDTNAKIVICYEGSRKRVYETLVQSGRLDKTKVIVLEKSCPDENEDQPITEKGFTFVRDFLEDAEKLPQPPLLQEMTKLMSYFGHLVRLGFQKEFNIQIIIFDFN